MFRLFKDLLEVWYSALTLTVCHGFARQPGQWEERTYRHRPLTPPAALGSLSCLHQLMCVGHVALAFCSSQVAPTGLTGGMSPWGCCPSSGQLQPQFPQPVLRTNTRLLQPRKNSAAWTTGTATSSAERSRTPWCVPAPAGTSWMTTASPASPQVGGACGHPSPLPPGLPKSERPVQDSWSSRGGLQIWRQTSVSGSCLKSGAYTILPNCLVWMCKLRE